MTLISSAEAAIETRVLDILAQAGSFAESVLASPRTIHAFGIRQKLVARYEAFLDDAHQLGKKKNALWGLLFSTEYCIIYAGEGLAFWQGVRMIANNEVDSLGTVFTVIMSVVIATTAITIVAPNLIAFTRAATASAQLLSLIDRRSKINPFDDTGSRPNHVDGVLDMENVSFSYPTRPTVQVLKNFSLHVPAGKVTALVGPSGSGKSTIVGLVERWYQAEAERIKLDGTPIDQLNLNWLRTNVRLVQQEPILFNLTVFENIAYGLAGTPLEHCSLEEKRRHVEEAAKFAFAHDFIVGLPDGYETQIGERGGLLSGGQKQRIAIARSIISDPKVLLLDEATSALDPHSEHIVQKALDNVSQSRTTIVIAHKLATIKNADNIVVMDKGQIMEQGTHASLLAADGIYARLIRAQNLNTPPAHLIEEDERRQSEERDEKSEEADIEKPLTRYATAEEQRMQSLAGKDDFSLAREKGLMSSIWSLVKENPELKWTFLCILVCCVAASGVWPGQAFLIAQEMDLFTLPPDAMVAKGDFLALMFFVMGLGCLVFYFTLGWACNVASQIMNRKYRKTLLNGMLRQDIQFFDRPENTVGALTSRLNTVAQGILDLMGINAGLIIITVVSVVATGILSIVISWKLGLVGVLAGTPPIVGAGYLRIRLESRMDTEASKRFSQSAGVASESVTAIRTVSSLAIERQILDRYTEELDRAIRRSTLPLLRMMIFFSLTQAVELFVLALGFWWGSKLLTQNEITFYQFFVSFIGIFFAGQNAGLLFSYSSSITKGKSSAAYYFWLQNLEPIVQETPENSQQIPAGCASIDFEDVRFSYPLRPAARVLRGVDLKVRSGEFVALVGASGCGKSTMIQMLERFYDPTSGVLRVDGEALSATNPNAYRSNVALVQQEPTLYQGSIRENVAMGLAEASSAIGSSSSPSSSAPENQQTDSVDAKVETALRAANAWDFVCSLPEGVHTPCGASGSQLSGGQRQRIAIARALVRKPRVLLLDEATSALDTESERVVQQALAEAASAGDRITVAVAHRLSTVKDADHICVFYGGRIVEMGTHDELLALGAMYKQMCEAQSLGA